MKCEKCGCSVFQRPLMRVNEKGLKGIFWCELCVKKHEPELYSNEKADETDVEKDLKEAFYKPEIICSYCNKPWSNCLHTGIGVPMRY